MSTIRLTVLMFCCVTASTLAFGGNGSPPVTADVVLLNGKVVTLDGDEGTGSVAQAIAVKGDRILAVGSNAQMTSLVRRGETQTIDLGGRLVVPGLIDSHAHLQSLGVARLNLALVDTVSEQDVADRVAARASTTPSGGWIQGRGWDQNDWADQRFPTADSLTAAAPEHPVYLTRVDGHAAWVNRRALTLAGITRATQDPEGGRIVRDASGEPTGVLIDNARSLVSSRIPARSRAELKTALVGAMAEAARFGLTGLHDAGTSRQTIELLQELLAEKRVTIRLNLLLPASDESLVREYFAKGPQIGLGDGRLTIRSVKAFADGALGSRGAALLEDYADEPGNKGLLLTTKEDLQTLSEKALATGYQVATHAIGDRANRMVLDAYEAAFKAIPPQPAVGPLDHRFRIEHAQIIDALDIPRFAALGVIASMQTTHATSDMPWVPDRLGASRTAESAYVWQSLLRSGARFANGSDAPVESIDPLLGLYAGVTRQRTDGEPPNGWAPEQRLSREEALRSFTIDAAYASFDEGERGSLEVNKLADLVVLSKDVMTVAPRDILTTTVDVTMVGGQIVYERDGAR